MTNYIIKEKLEVSDSLTVTGSIFKVLSENGLNKIENLDTYVPISGKVDNLVADNLVLCEYINYDLTIGGYYTYVNLVEYE